MIPSLSETANTVLRSMFNPVSFPARLIGQTRRFVCLLPEPESVIHLDRFEWEVRRHLELCLCKGKESLQEKGLYGCGILFRNAVQFYGRGLDGQWGFKLPYAVKYPEFNLRFYRYRGAEGIVSESLEHEPGWLWGGVLEEPCFYGHESLRRASNPMTPGSELVGVAWTFSGVGERARRNPSLPEKVLRECMVAGSWDAWLNPAARMVLMASPGEDLLLGATQAALDCFPVERIYGLGRDTVGVLSVLLHRARIRSVSRRLQREVLCALKELLAPILKEV